MASTTKTKGPSPESRGPREASGKTRPKPAPSPAGSMTARPSATRETIESVVVAFVLAFLFKTFEAEAFVIPTGSMAPTLYGQHRDVYCEQCGTRFAVGVRTV